MLYEAHHETSTYRHAPRRALAACGGRLSRQPQATRTTTLLNVSYDPTRELYQRVQRRVRQVLAGEDRSRPSRFSSRTAAPARRRARSSTASKPTSSRWRSPTTSTRSQQAGLINAGLAEAAAAEQLAVHVDDRVPRPQGQSEGDQGLERSGQAGRRASSRRIRRRPAARAGTTWRPGSTRKRQPGGNDAKAREFVTQLFKNVPVLDSGARGVDDDVRAARHRRRAARVGERSLSRARRSQGQGRDRRPVDQHPRRAAGRRSSTRSSTRRARARSPRRTCSSSTRRKGRRSPRRHHYRPRDREGRGEVRGARSPTVKLFTIDEAFGGWQAAQKTHFADGGTFDQIYRPGAGR